MLTVFALHRYNNSGFVTCLHTELALIAGAESHAISCSPSQDSLMPCIGTWAFKEMVQRGYQI